MLITKKYTFTDLNYFVDARFGYLHDAEQTFYNQARATTEVEVLARKTSKKAELVGNRVMNLLMQQGAVDFFLDVVQRWQYNWEELLRGFEHQYQETLRDDSRSCLYDLFDKLFTILVTYHECVHDLDGKLAVCSQKQDPIPLLWAVLSRNLALLEKLFLQIQNLQRLVDTTDQIFRNFR